MSALRADGDGARRPGRRPLPRLARARLHLWSRLRARLRSLLAPRLAPCLGGLAGLALLVCAASCSNAQPGTASGAFGLTQRTVVRGVNVPTGLPQPTPMRAALAFPRLLFDQPLLITAPPDGSNRLVVVEQQGVVRIFANDPLVAIATTFLDMRSQVNVSSEEGLLGLAFHPDYANTGTFYTYHSAFPPRRSVISRWHVSATNPSVADPGSQEILLEFDQPYSNHNGGALAFGPDGMLYVASGDGGSANDPNDNAQSLNTLLGKILRLDPNGAIPADNPFVGGTNGERGEIWAYGLRNPWRIGFDRVTGALWAGDVGQNDVEEVDIIAKGANYGWRVYEGNRANINPGGVPPTAFAQPVQTYGRSMGNSVTGGYVYRGSRLPSLVGAYVYADFGTGRVWALVHDGTQTVSNTEIASVPSPTSFGEDQAGELYACSFDGNIYRLEDTGGGSGGAMPATLSATGLFADVPSLTPAPGLIEFEVNAPLWSDGARKRRWLALPGTAQITFAPTEAWDFPVGTVLVKHFEIDTAPGQTRRLEVRVLLRHVAGWQGYTYRWNTAGTDADLLTGSATDTFTVQEPGAPPRQQTWYFPSSADCLACHTAAAGYVLGVRTPQLHRDFAYPALLDNQLRAWNHIALFTADIGIPTQYEALPDPADPTQPLADRARAYLAANCAMCHRPQGATPVDMDLRHDVPVAQMHAVGVAATSPAAGAPGTQRITAFAKEQSEVWERMRRRDSWAMPPLGSKVVDSAGVALVGAWIDSGAGN